jgi:HUS1 checkpoint protein
MGLWMCIMLFLLGYYVRKNGSEFVTAVVLFLTSFVLEFSFFNFDRYRNHLPPIVNTPDVQLEFQLDRPLRPVIERMKAISPIIYVDGSMSGELVLRIDSDAVSIQTFYDKLVPRVDEDSPNNNEVKKCTLKIDSKKLLAALQWQSTMGRGAVGSYIICMIENEMMVVHVMLNPEELGFFTYYVPVHFLGDVLD